MNPRRCPKVPRTTNHEPPRAGALSRGVAAVAPGVEGPAGLRQHQGSDLHRDRDHQRRGARPMLPPCSRGEPISLCLCVKRIGPAPPPGNGWCVVSVMGQAKALTGSLAHTPKESKRPSRAPTHTTDVYQVKAALNRMHPCIHNNRA